MIIEPKSEGGESCYYPPGQIEVTFIGYGKNKKVIGLPPEEKGTLKS